MKAACRSFSCLENFGRRVVRFKSRAQSRRINFYDQTAMMNIFDARTPWLKTTIKSAALTALLGLSLASCGKSVDRSPQAPPRPKTSSWISDGDVQKAVFTYSKSPSIHYQDGLGREIPRLVIRT